MNREETVVMQLSAVPVKYYCGFIGLYNAPSDGTGIQKNYTPSVPCGITYYTPLETMRIT
jgi:hypothetical protein